MTDYVEEATKIIVEAAGPQHPENWSKYEYALQDLVIRAAAELEQTRELVAAAIAYHVEQNREPGDDWDHYDAFERFEDAVRAYLKNRTETTNYRGQDGE